MNRVMLSQPARAIIADLERERDEAAAYAARIRDLLSELAVDVHLDAGLHEHYGTAIEALHGESAPASILWWRAQRAEAAARAERAERERDAARNTNHIQARDLVEAEDRWQQAEARADRAEANVRRWRKATLLWRGHYLTQKIARIDAEGRAERAERERDLLAYLARGGSVGAVMTALGLPDGPDTQDWARLLETWRARGEAIVKGGVGGVRPGTVDAAE